MHKVVSQYLLTCYSDGTFKITERKLTERDGGGRFTGNGRVLGQTVCPVCGAHLNIIAKEVAR